MVEISENIFKKFSNHLRPLQLPLLQALNMHCLWSTCSCWLDYWNINIVSYLQTASLPYAQDYCNVNCNT